MAKIEIVDTKSGFNLAVINSNFEALADELNDKVLYRENPTGEPNQMGNPLDMNGNDIINGGLISGTDVSVGGVSIGTQVSTAQAAAVTATAQAALASAANAQVHQVFVGAFPSDPSVSGVTQGGLYFNTTTMELRYLRGTAWVSFPQANQVFHAPLVTGTDFTTGTTVLTLPSTAFTKVVLWLMFDGAYQQPSTYTLTDQTHLSYPSGIPAGVQKIDVAYIAPLSSVIVDDNSLTTAKYQNLSVTLGKLAANSVDSTKIVDGSVGTAELADGNVTASKMANSSVGSNQIIASSILDVNVAGAANINTQKIRHVSALSGTVGTLLSDILEGRPSTTYWAVAKSGGDQAANLIAAANGGSGELYLPAGQYNVSNVTFTKGQLKLIGAGPNATIINSTSVSGDIISLGDGTANPANQMIANLTIQSQSSRSGGAGLRFRNGHRTMAQNITFNQNMYTGLQLDGGAQQFEYFVDDIEVNSGQYSVLIGSDGTNIQDVFLTKAVCAGMSQVGMYIIQVSGLYVRDFDILGAPYAVMTYPASGQRVIAVTLDNVYADTGSNHGWNLITNGGMLADICLIKPWASTNGTNTGVAGNGININQGSGIIRGMSIKTPRMLNNGGHGIYLGPSTDVHIEDCMINNNSGASAGVYSGLYVENNVSDWSVRGGRIGYGGTFGNLRTHRSNVFVAGASNDRYNISGLFVNNGYAINSISDNGTGTNKFVGNNIT